jgi:hypothetical protein
MRTYANYAMTFVGAQLGPDERDLDVEWAGFVGDRTPTYEFHVPTAAARDAYVGLQAFDVGEYGHEILINGEALSGFDIPTGDGWQYWIDSLARVSLAEGTNTLRIARDTTTEDSFAVGNVVVHWKEPIAGEDELTAGEEMGDGDGRR